MPPSLPPSLPHLPSLPEFGQGIVDSHFLNGASQSPGLLNRTHQSSLASSSAPSLNLSSVLFGSHISLAQQDRRIPLSPIPDPVATEAESIIFVRHATDGSVIAGTVYGLMELLIVNKFGRPSSHYIFPLADNPLKI
jgi:hypothetical protein